MKFVIWFLGGIAVGMWAVILATDRPFLDKVLTLRTRLPDTNLSIGKIDNVPTPLFQNSTISLTPTDSHEPTPTPTPTPTPVAVKSMTPTPSPTLPKVVFTSEQLNGFIDQYSAQYGVDPNVLRAVAICESGFDAAKISRNGKYWGLFQFSVTAWSSNRAMLGLSADPNLRLNGEEAVRTAAYVISKGKGYMWPNCMP